jgi:hypothetical protein
MPNYVRNRLTLKGEESKIKELLKQIKGKKTLFDFNKVIPMPENVKQSMGEPGLNPLWYSWSIENWGVKWNAAETDDDRNNDSTRYFETAWSVPYPVISNLSELFPDVEMQLMWADEDASFNTGIAVFKDGKEYSVHRPKGATVEGFDLYFEMWPESKEDYIFVNGNYEYKE